MYNIWYADILAVGESRRVRAHKLNFVDMGSRTGVLFRSPCCYRTEVAGYLRLENDFDSCVRDVY